MTDEKQSQLALEDLQARLSFQEDTLSELSQIVARQDQQIARLEQQLGALAGKYRDLRDTLEEQPSALMEERPPHY